MSKGHCLNMFICIAFRGARYPQIYIMSMVWIYCHLSFFIVFSCQSCRVFTYRDDLRSVFIRECPQERIILQFQVRISIQTPPRHLNIRLDVINQRLHRHIIILRPYKPQYQYIQVMSVEIPSKLMQDMYLHTPHSILIIRIPAYGHNHGIYRPA